MKHKFILVTFLTLIPTTANAFDLQSPAGISQEQWIATDSYKNFQCPANTARGEGVDMNFTTTRADDFYFVTCSPIEITTPTITTQPTSETVTVSTSSNTAEVTVQDTTTATSTTSTATTTTTTQTNNVFTESAEFTAWFTKWFEKWFKVWFLQWLGVTL